MEWELVFLAERKSAWTFFIVFDLKTSFEVANFDLGSVAVYTENQDSRGVRGICKSCYNGKCCRRYRWVLEAATFNGFITSFCE